MKSDRRTFLQTMAAAAVTSAIQPSTQGQASSHSLAQTADRPRGSKPKHVVLMICDDLGYGDLGCYGSQIPTPNLDRLAHEGVRLTRFNAAHPICSASRAALLTGRYAQRSHTLGAYFPNADSGMSLEETTLADLFHRKGYRTKAIGKWHLGDRPQYLPTSRGFDSFYGVPYSDDMQPLPLMRDLQKLDADTDRDLLTQKYTAEALSFINDPSEKPLFLYLAYSYPHDPARASSDFRGKTAFGNYGDSVHEIDWSVGKIVDALRTKKMLDDTLVIFTSDHGPWYQGSPGVLRGRKGTTFEGGSRVPLICHWPRGLNRGFECDVWASNFDLLPTLVALCDLEKPAKQLDGIDISSVLAGNRQPINRPAILYFTPTASGGLEVHCARKGDWKLRVAQTTGEIYVSDWGSGREGFWLPHPELYNLAADPGESFDVAKLHPEIVQSILTEVRAQMPSFPPEVSTAFSKLEGNVASITTPPGAAPRPNNHQPLPAWAWEPPDRQA